MSASPLAAAAKGVVGPRMATIAPGTPVAVLTESAILCSDPLGSGTMQPTHAIASRPNAELGLKRVSLKAS